MGTYQFNKTRPDYALHTQWNNIISEQLYALAAVQGVAINRINYTGGQFIIETTPDLTAPQEAALGQIIADYQFRDWAADSEAVKPNAKTVLNDMEALYDFAAPYYTGLSGPQKATILANLTTDWNTATASEKADALRALLSLIVVAIYFIYLRFINGSGQ